MLQHSRMFGQSYRYVCPSYRGKLKLGGVAPVYESNAKSQEVLMTGLIPPMKWSGL